MLHRISKLANMIESFMRKENDKFYRTRIMPNERAANAIHKY